MLPSAHDQKTLRFRSGRFNRIIIVVAVRPLLIIPVRHCVDRVILISPCLERPLQLGRKILKWNRRAAAMLTDQAGIGNATPCRYFSAVSKTGTIPVALLLRNNLFERVLPLFASLQKPTSIDNHFDLVPKFSELLIFAGTLFEGFGLTFSGY